MTVTSSFLRHFAYRRRIARIHRELGVPRNYRRRHDLPLQIEPESLDSIGPDL